MGARVNVQVRYKNKPSVYLYSHWKGNSLILDVKRAIARRQRWDDPQYLTRIIFCEMVRENWRDETGFGIASYPGEEQYPTITVDTRDNTVCCSERTWTFVEFAEAKDEDLEAIAA